MDRRTCHLIYLRLLDWLSSLVVQDLARLGLEFHLLSVLIIPFAIFLVNWLLARGLARRVLIRGCPRASRWTQQDVASRRGHRGALRVHLRVVGHSVIHHI